MVFNSTVTHSTGSRVLLVGDTSNLAAETSVITEGHFENCDDLLDAADKAQTNNYDTIAVIMPEHSADFTLSLKSLRKTTTARIILLAQMYQEPTARRFVESYGLEAPQADDYIIYPDGFSAFFSPARNFQAGSDSYQQRINALEKLATEDDLTGLKNRRYILEFTRQIIELAKKNHNRVTLLLFDIDNFKRYNDLFGHCAGDEILRQAAVLMKHCCRAGDVVGRIGGDEFAVVFWDQSRTHQTNSAGSNAQERRLAKAEHPAEAIYMAQRLVADLKKTQLSALSGLGQQGKGVLTISGGLASFQRDGSTAEELFQQADKALLDAKRSGKNRIYLVGSPGTDQTVIAPASEQNAG